MATGTIGQLKEFDPDNEKVTEYLERVELFFTANSINEDKQVAVLLTAIGRKTYALLSSLLSPTKPQEKSFAQLSTALKDHYQPKPLVIAERYKFYKRKQSTEETIAEYMAQLRRLATHCEFKTFLDEALRDKLVCGMRSENTRQKLLTEADLTLTKAVETAQGMEAAAKNCLEMRQDEERAVDRVAVPPRSYTPRDRNECYRCGGTNHDAQSCRFKDAMCHKCKKRGHIARKCRAREGTRTIPARWVEAEDTPSHTVYKIGSGLHPMKVDIRVEGRPITMEVETGAAVSLVPEHVWKKEFPQLPPNQTNVVLQTYTGDPIPFVGKTVVHVSYGTQSSQLPLYIVKGGGPSLLGREWLRKLMLDWKTIGMAARAPASVDSLLKALRRCI